MKRARSRKCCIAEFFGGGYRENCIVRRESFCDRAEVDRYPSLHKPRAFLGYIFDQHISPPVPQKPKQRRRFFILSNSISNLNNASITSTQQLYLVSGNILEEEPSSRFCHRSIMSFFDLEIIQSIQRHGLAVVGE